MRIWKPCPEFEGIYEVSDDGLVRRSGVPGKGVRIGRILRPARNRPYDHVQLCKDCGVFTREVHRLVCEAFHGPRPSDRHCVAHKDGDQKNNNKNNLEWVLYNENSYHQVLHGTSKGRVREGRRVLTDNDISAIRADHRAERRIAKEYGLCPGTIGQIRRRETYKHLPPRDGDYVPEQRKRGFSDHEVRSIRNDIRPVHQIADSYDVSNVTIYEIKNRNSYSHVKD